jgi:hypothetical protein
VLLQDRKRLCVKVAEAVIKGQQDRPLRKRRPGSKKLQEPGKAERSIAMFGEEAYMITEDPGSRVGSVIA